MRRLSLLLLAMVVALPQAAWAHGGFTPNRVARGATAEVDLALPSERPNARTSRVVISMPRGFTPRDCQEPVGWTCAVKADAVEWTDVAGVRAETNFVLTLTVSSTTGTYPLPVKQTYDDGAVSDFSGPPGSENEAPVITVTGGGPAPTSAAPRPTATRTASSPPSQPVTATATASAVTSASSAAAPTAGATAPTGSEPPTALSATASASPSPPRAEVVSGDDSGGGLPVKLLAGALVAALLAVIAAQLRSPQPKA